MKRFGIHLLGLAWLLSLAACNKNEPVSNTNVWIPAELKSYFLFYPGSYWIMELPGTDFVDSVFVEFARLDTLPIQHPGSRETIGFKEKLTVSYFSPFYGRRYHFEVIGEAFCGQRGNDFPCFKAVKKNFRGTPDTLTSESTMAYYPFEPSRILPAQSRGSNTLVADQLLDGYEQADSIYNQVLRVTVTVDETEQNQISVRHFAPGVGLLRWQVPDWGFNWVVTRYKTKQTPIE